MRNPTTARLARDFDLEIRPEDTAWLVIRISDPDLVDSGGQSAPLGSYGAALAYSSPFFLRGGQQGG